MATGAFTFGPFRLLPEERVLLEDGKAVRLGGRALDILTALVVRSGTLISKEELISYAWPRARVEEANLRVHIGALRNALGENRAGVRYIATVAGRGYCFVAPVHREDSSAVAALPPGMSSATLPVPITRMIGREDAEYQGDQAVADETATLAATELFGYANELYEHKRVHPAGDLMSVLTQVELDGDCRIGIKTAGSGSSVMVLYLPSSTIPTTCMRVPSINLKYLPTAPVSEPKTLRANSRFTMATRGALLSSCQVKALPASRAEPAA